MEWIWLKASLAKSCLTNLRQTHLWKCLATQTPWREVQTMLLETRYKERSDIFYVKEWFYFCQLKTKKGKSRLIFLKKNRAISHICALKADKKEQQIILHFFWTEWAGSDGWTAEWDTIQWLVVTLLTCKNCPIHRADLDTWTDRDRDTNTRKRDHELLGHTKQQNDI